MADTPTVIPLDQTYDGMIGLDFDPTADGDLHATIPVRDQLRQPMGLVHGGVYAGIAESMATVATIYRVNGDGKFGVGLSNQTSFLRPILRGAIHATAKVLHTGRTSWVWDVSFADEEGRTCAVCRMTIAIRPLPGADLR